MRRFQKATIKDVARHAGVSTTTVSVFVSGREDVCSPATAERIRAAVNALNYTPSSLVSGLHKRETQTIGVCMYSPVDPHLQFGGLFFERLWRGVLAQAHAQDYSLLHYPSSVRDTGRIDAFLDGRVDGILIHAHSHENERALRLASAGMPTVVLTRSAGLPEGCGAAFADEAVTADLALSHLWGLGHRRIAHIAGPVDAGPGAQKMTYVDDIANRRLEGYLSWMGAHGRGESAVIGYARNWTGEFVAEVVSAWAVLPAPPTAVFCANDALALAVIEAVRARGGTVPGTLSVVGVDDSAAAREAVVPLTSIDVAIEKVGSAGVEALLRLMNGAPIEECRIAVSGARLVPRASTAPLT